MDTNTLHIEIAYATPEQQIILEQQVAEGTSPRDVVLASDIEQYFPEIDKQSCDIGIFGKAIRPDQQLENGDRIEIYRPLLADPKEVRKRRAAEGLRMKKGGGKVDAAEEAETDAAG
ncbi:MAG: RnfH family protein [Gammaproteobacteria bacterium]|nr:RnfH family protein [Gammaproteobacteria bacterium]MBL6998625.1 RnfH family protein [Gammaproteobacteria bacterium]